MEIATKMKLLMISMLVQIISKQPSKIKQRNWADIFKLCVQFLYLTISVSFNELNSKLIADANINKRF